LQIRGDSLEKNNNRTDRKNKGSNLGLFLFGIGVLLILSAAGFAGYNFYCMKDAEKVCTEVVAQFEEFLAHSGAEEISLPDEENDAEQAASLGAVVASVSDAYHGESISAVRVSDGIVIDGVQYIGMLSVPSLGLKLPVRADLSYPALRKSPCRYSGSVEEGRFVIAAHNYLSHFGHLGSLAIGESVLFTDAWGNVTEYVVVQSEVLDPDEVERMINSDFDLTLFTCTFGGSHRTTVRCDKA